ncbi:predicted protein [Chaetomium globosum CBS 148.51]|uniref:Uncharacterized protein n=1 Tax=Chaetomium globosum (strain ATCC 6205 / CBS 148.51 / DSM 1962 / NBRC 6347 / NRRL 1970) TaxID=306901 RepID=Q2H6Z9_CHAGB|nr:uncharacterized protein CHGG_05566 [Chaetomium globosum CBS 148.51]EAQ88947.1 predicted protein [Chaetomium globosum CBS 148.51]
MMQQQIIGKPTWVGLKDTPMGAECLNSDFVTWASILGEDPKELDATSDKSRITSRRPRQVPQ